jgi:PAS domain S-box-containing protein
MIWAIVTATGSILIGLALFMRYRSSGEEKFQDDLIPYDSILGAALDGIGEAVFIASLDHKIIWNNMAAERIFGNIRGRSCHEFRRDDKAAGYLCFIDDVISQGRVFYREEKLTVRTGETRPFLVSSAPVREHGGKIIAVVNSFRDFFQIERLEEAEARSRLSYIRLFENMSDGFALHKVIANENGEPVDYVFLDVNRAYMTLTGLSREDLLGKRVTEAVPGILESEFDWIGILGKVGLTGEPVRIEQFFEPHQKWYLMNAYSPEPGSFAVIFEDITDRKGREEMARASLEVNEILMKEVHQRVQNNLTSISDILNIQASCMPEEWDWSSKVLRDTQVRVMSMALVHKILCRMDDLVRIPFAIYLRDLVEHLREVFGQGREGIRIVLEVPEELTLNVDTAVPCGLILTELVSNSLLHAFPEGGTGTLNVTMKEGENGGYTLEEKDDGIGIPGHVNLEEPATLGLRLLNSHVDLIHGEKRVTVDGGTTVSIAFPEIDEIGTTRF